MDAWPAALGAITLFLDDLAAGRRFYGGVLGLPLVFEDDESAAYKLGGTLINLLQDAAAEPLIAPARVAPMSAGARFQLTLDVDDVDATCADLTGRGVELLNGPVNRPWGLRTASFRDPGGHIWEIAAPIPG